MRLHFSHLTLGALLCTLAAEIHSMRTPETALQADMPLLPRHRPTAPPPAAHRARRGPLNMALPIPALPLPSTLAPLRQPLPPENLEARIGG